MNLILLFLFINLTYAMVLYDRQVIDKLSGYRNCSDFDYPVKLAELSFVPYPIIIGKWFFAKYAGFNYIEIQQGATILFSYSYNGNSFIENLDFCSEFSCPFAVKNFNDTALKILPSGIKDPTNTTLIFDTKFEVYGANRMKLMCIEGPLEIYFP